MAFFLIILLSLFEARWDAVPFDPAAPVFSNANGIPEVLLSAGRDRCLTWPVTLPPHPPGTVTLQVTYILDAARHGQVVWRATFHRYAAQAGIMHSLTRAVSPKREPPHTAQWTLEPLEAAEDEEPWALVLCRNATHTEDTAPGAVAIRGVQLEVRAR